MRYLSLLLLGQDGTTTRRTPEPQMARIEEITTTLQNLHRVWHERASMQAARDAARGVFYPGRDMDVLDVCNARLAFLDYRRSVTPRRAA